MPASDREARESAACRRFLSEAGTVIISPLVLAEVDHLAKARFGSHARTSIIDFTLAQIRRLRFQVPDADPEVLDTARLVQRQYAGLDLELADAVNVAVAAQYRTNEPSAGQGSTGRRRLTARLQGPVGTVALTGRRVTLAAA
jgi:predicted nucleic acid-binding protein